jgi:hypothetical protein
MRRRSTTRPQPNGLQRRRRRTTRSAHKNVAYHSCPFCSYTDPSERVVRAHITKADDTAHENHNAFVDRMFVQARADDDTIVEDVATSPEGGTRYVGDDSVTFVPDGVDPETQRRTAEILDAVIKAPMATQADLAEEIYGDRTQGASQISKAISRYLKMDGRADDDGEGKDDEGNDVEETGTSSGRDSRLERMEFYELTEKQRRVILAWLDDPDPDRTRAEIARAASVSSTYVPVVREDQEFLIDQLQAELDAGSLSFKTLVARAELDQPEQLALSSIEGITIKVKVRVRSTQSRFALRRRLRRLKPRPKQKPKRSPTSKRYRNRMKKEQSNRNRNWKEKPPRPPTPTPPPRRSLKLTPTLKLQSTEGAVRRRANRRQRRPPYRSKRMSKR